MKTCSRCNEQKHRDQFPKKARNKDGLAAHCKECQKVWNKRYYEENREKELDRHKAYRAEFGDKIRDWGFKYRADKLDKIRENSAAWRKSNPEGVAYHTAKSRATKRNATPDWLTEDQSSEIKAMYRLAKKFETVFNTKYHVDHIVPLRGKDICGLHVPWNLQLLEAGMNVKKSNYYDPNRTEAERTTA